MATQRPPKDQYLITMCGLPGAQKTTFAQLPNLEKYIPYAGDRTVVSLDDIRLWLFGDWEGVNQAWTPETEKHIRDIAKASVRAGLSAGRTVIVDATNRRKHYRQEYVRIAAEFPGVVTAIVWPNMHPRFAIDNSPLFLRDFIIRCHREFEPPTKDEADTVLHFQQSDPDDPWSQYELVALPENSLPIGIYEDFGPATDSSDPSWVVR